MNEYNKDNKLRVFTAFSGYDSQCIGLERLKEYCPEFDYDLVGWSEINKWSCVAHDALFPQFEGLNYGDISKIDWKDVPDFDLFTYSSPCFVAGTQIIVCDTVTGNPYYKNIEDIKVSDYVLTHKNRFKKVLKTMSHLYTDRMYYITLSYGRTLICTKNHPFCVYNPFNSEHIAEVTAQKLNALYKLFHIEIDSWTETEKCNVAEKTSYIEYNKLVYNIEVEEDHTYVANGCVVSNCTDWSAAGMQKGGAEGSGTRSSLLWECRKAIDIKRPKYCLLENVLGLLQDKFFPYFQKWIDELKIYGYRSFYQVLNAKDYGIPHNRPRVFLVSIHNSVDIPAYYFPNELGDEARGELYEILEPDEDVNPKFIRPDWRKKHYMELNEDAIARLNVPANEVPGKYDMKPMGIYCHCSDAFNNPPLYNLARTLKTESIESGILYKKDGEWHERLFTYKELFRLMGLKDSEYEVLRKNVTSINHLQRMAGNSIVVNVLFHIFRKMFVDREVEIGQSMPLF